MLQEVALKLAHTLALAVVRHRAEHKLTQADFAKEMGWQQPAVARLESSDHTPRLGTIQRLVDAEVISVQITQVPKKDRRTRHSGSAKLRFRSTVAKVGRSHHSAGIG